MHEPRALRALDELDVEEGFGARRSEGRERGRRDWSAWEIEARDQAETEPAAAEAEHAGEPADADAALSDSPDRDAELADRDDADRELTDGDEAASDLTGREDADRCFSERNECERAVGGVELHCFDASGYATVELARRASFEDV